MREKQEKQRYVDVLSDSGFKALFGDQENKPVLIDFLNAVLPKGRRVKDLTYTTTEFEGLTPNNKAARLDLRCEDEDGTSFIIEMQKYDHDNFFKRCVSYGAKVYDLKTIKGNRDYDISPVYVIGILGVEYFDRSDDHWRDNFISDYTFREKSTAEVICETISLIFVELKRFDKALEDCKDIIDKWCYALKHMSKLDSLPIELQNRIFRKLFKAAEIAQFNPDKRTQYEQEMMTERDELNIRHTAERKLREALEAAETARIKGHKDGLKEGRKQGRKEGREEGKAEGREEAKIEMARNMMANGLPISDILKYTGLTEEKVLSLP